MRLLISEYLISQRFQALQITGQMFAFNTVYLCLTHSFGVNPKLTTTKFGLKKLETTLYRAVQNAFRHPEAFRRGTRVRQTDAQTDRQTNRQA